MMPTNRRERLFAIVAAVAVVVLLADAYLLRPLTAAYEELDQRRVEALDGLRSARTVIQARRGAQQRWRRMLAAGLSEEPSIAESQGLHAMRNWAEEAGVNLASLQPDRRRSAAASTGFDDTPRETLREIDLSARVAGSMEQVARLFYKLETAALPVRIERVRIAQQRNSDDEALTVELRASTIYRDVPEDMR